MSYTHKYIHVSPKYYFFLAFLISQTDLHEDVNRVGIFRKNLVEMGRAVS